MPHREMKPAEKPSWRKPAGALAIVVYVMFWVLVVVSFSAEIGSLPILVQMLIYVVLGVIWIAPLKPVLRWMETGRWK